ncbi:MAG: AAA family ATPase [Oscillospiraceae bacterium]|nr:AAA family ATPase [Oscillospiraceae bacterium]
MKIRKLRATFGKLNNDTLSFHSGLNVIYAPNESGKSTWCAFIRAMLYGIDTSERAKGNYLPDKQRYAPWSGAPMEGSMDLTADGCDITLQRSTTSRNAPMREFSAVYSGTNNPVEGMNGLNCGELLTGVTKDVFRRSAFIEQGSVAVSGSPELEKRIQAIVSSGEEQTSFSEADERLSGWQRKRRWHRRGLLPTLEGQMDEAQRLLDDMDSSVETLKDLEKQMEEAQQRCATLEDAVTESRRRQRKEALNRLSTGRALVTQRSEMHDDALAELSRSRDALRRSQFGDLDLEELEEEVAEDRAKLEELQDGSQNQLSFLPALVFSILAIVCAVLFGAFTKVPLVIGAGVFCVAAVFFFLRYSKNRQYLLQASSEREAILRKYKISLPDDLEGILQQRYALEEAAVKAAESEVETREALERAGKQLHELEEGAINDLDFAAGDSEAARLSRLLATARSEAAALQSRISGLNGRLSAMGDPMVLASSLSALREEYEEIQAEYDAITLAEETLRDADAELQSRFSPELSRVAAAYMSEMTGGRYEDVLIGQDFSARARTKDDSVARDAEFLSAGTMDLMYLAVRLAVCELALPEGEPCPLIIDDALVNMDADREAQALKLLKRIALKRQVILFTCRKPEGT